MGSSNSNDWVRISELLLGPVGDDFLFIAKHKSNSYTAEVNESNGQQYSDDQLSNERLGNVKQNHGDNVFNI